MKQIEDGEGSNLAIQQLTQVMYTVRFMVLNIR